jgi:signal transduction histidine kinase
MTDDVPSPPAEAILDRMTDALFGLDTDWEFTYLNERARVIVCEAIGEEYTVAELVGRNIWEEIPEAVGTPFEEQYRDAMRTQEPAVFEEYYEPLDVWLEVRVYPSESGLSIYVQDITLRRRQRAELEERATVVREMYEVVADREAAFEEQVADLLAIGQRVLGTSYGSLSRIRGEEYVFEVVRAPEGTIETGDVVDLSATNCEQVVLTEESLVAANIPEERPDLTDRAGYTEWGISCYLGTPVVIDDEVYGTFCFYDTGVRAEPFSEWEITLVDLMGRWISVALERKLVETRLRQQNERLESFASIVSHDLRNPLNTADGWLEMAREDGDGEAFERVADSHDRMRELIEDVLAMVRAGRDVEDPDPVDVDDVATDAWEQVATGEASLTVAESFTLWGDRSRLMQLFENLFRNSVEHGATDTAGLAVTVDRLAGGFYVDDDGVGIPPEDRDCVFDTGYTTDEEGTGIGLGIVEDIATAHGWAVSADESDAGGARFAFTGVEVIRD